MKKFLKGAFGWLPNLAANGLVHLVFLVAVLFVILEVAFGDAVVRVGAESMRLAVFLVLSVLTMKAAVQAFWARAWSPAEVMSIALCALATAITLHAAWVPFQKYVGLPSWFPTGQVTSAVIVAIAMAGIGYLIPVSRYRFARVSSSAASWTSIFVAGFLAGVILTFFLVTGLTWG